MKNGISLLLLFFATISVAQHIQFEPAKPAPGETVKIIYNTAGTPLEGITGFEATAYLFMGELPHAIELDLEADGQVYSGMVKTTTETKALFFSFQHKGKDIVDDNNKKGYGTLLYDGEQPVKGAYAAKSSIYSGTGRFVHIQGDRAKALKKLQKEFALHPESRQEAKLQKNYAFLAVRAKDEAAIGDVKKMVEEILAGKKSEEKWMTAHELSSTIEEEALQEEIAAKLEKKFPKGKYWASELRQQFFAEKDLAQKEALFNTYQKYTEKDPSAAENLGLMARVMATQYGREAKPEKMEPYLKLIEKPSQIASMYNSLAWPLTGESLEGEARNLDLAKEWSAGSLEIMKKLIANPELDDRSYYTEAQKQNQWEGMHAMYADTYALTMYKSGEYEEALKYQQIACDRDKFSDLDMNYRYGMYYEKVKGGEAAETLVEGLIRKGKASPKMLEQHKRLFLANNTLESAYEKYAADMDREASALRKKELKKKMINEKAPEFQLVNLDGQTVRSKDLLGKIVIIDFWATWCGPCIASFPGMQKAVSKYEKDPEIAFVFIDTWESTKDKEKNAADFMEKNAYTFNVLMDNENTTVEAYKVEGIPTKFILDKDGHIRFKSIGYGGSTDGLAREIADMIELLQLEGEPGAD